MKERFDAIELNVVKEQITKYCSFSLGREYLLERMPSYDILWVRRELSRTKEALDLHIRYGAMPFLGLYDIRDSVADAMRDVTLRTFELRRIAQYAHSVQAISTYMKSSEVETPYIDELCDSFGNTSQVSEAIEKCINANDEVYDHASSELQSIRRNIRASEGDIAKEVQRFISAHASKLMDTITTTRNDRICVLMKVAEKNSVRGFVHGESASGQTAYVEPESLLQLNNKLQSLRSREKDEIERILYGLTQIVRAHGDCLLSNQETFALLDASFAKAAWAFHIDGCVATIDEQSQHLLFVQARHPLIDSKHVVANTFEIKKPYHSLLITGSNTGGKTVTLKTIGLFVAMSQCGMPVCASEAIIPFFKQIFIDIGDDQSIQESLSTFSAHVSKLADICEHVNADSLVLLDELGSGTDPKEGESLAIAVLEELRLQQAMVVATTHYSALKKYAKQNDEILISSVAFDVESMRPTYRYMEGISGQSNALAIARRYHMKESVLTMAQEIKDANRDQQDDLLEKLEAQIAQQHEQKAKLNETLEDVKKLQASLQFEKQQFEREKTKRLQALEEAYLSDMEETRHKADEIIKELRNLSSDAKPHVITALKKQLQDLQEQEEQEETQAEVQLAIGDYVCIEKLNYYGEIIDVQKDKVTVLTNGMRMNTKRSDVVKVKRPSKKKQERGYGKVLQKASFSMELNVIGMTVQEALPVIDKYLDNAIIAKVYQVRLIHGVGTGALRTGIHSYLKKHPKVEDYRMGGQGEGGLGASVVSLKHKEQKHG